MQENNKIEDGFNKADMQKVQEDIDSVNRGAIVDKAKLHNLPDLKQLLFDCQQVMTGYSQDETWSEWDESVRQRLVSAQYLYESPAPSSTPQSVEQDELWDEVVSHIVTFTGSTKMEAFRLCENLRKQFGIIKL